MLKQGKNVGLLGQGNQIGLDKNLLADGVPEQLVLVAGAGATAIGTKAMGTAISDAYRKLADD